MENRQEKYLKLREIFNEVIEAEVRKYLKINKHQLKETEGSDSKITFFSVKGSIFFLSKYELVGDGDGGNEAVKQAEDINFLNEAPTFIIPDELGKDRFWLHLERPDIEHEDRSYFFKEAHDKTRLFCLYGEDVISDDEFKKLIMQMMKEIAPERIEEVQQLLQ